MCTSEENEKRRSKINRAMLRLIVCSDLRSSILVDLKEGKKPLSELRDELEITSTTAIHALRELEKDNFLFQDESKNYALTQIGEIAALKLLDFLKAIDILNKYADFWLTHDLSDIPNNFLEKIGALKNSELREAPATDVLKILTDFVELLKNSKEIRGVTSMFIPEFGSLIKELTIDKHIDVEIVLTKEILDGIDTKVLREVFNDKSSKLKLYLLQDDVKAAFTITESLLSFGLFNLDGTYDWSKDLIDTTEEGVGWGLDLFEWYRQRSEEFHL